MCRITVLKLKDNITPLPQLLLPFINIVRENGESNRDGTGISVPVQNIVLKSALPAEKYLWNDEIFDLLEKWHGEDLFGHVRISTVDRGVQNPFNSHPFDVGNIIGMHNGHFNNYEQIRDKNSIENGIDSFVFFKRLAQIAGDNPLTPEIINKALKEFTGNYALAMYDKKSQKVFLVTGLNDLYIYDLGYGYLINTYDELEVIKRSLFQIALVSQIKYPVPEPEKLASFKIFELTSVGCVEVGNVERSVEQVSRNYANYYGETARSTQININNLINLVAEIAHLGKFYSIGYSGAEDLINCLAKFDIVNRIPFTTKSDLQEIENFLQWLYSNKLDLQENIEKQDIWIKSNLTYAEAKTKNPNFEEPFFMNSIKTLKDLQ